MIATANEMLFYHTFRHDAQDKLGLSTRQMMRLRGRISAKELSEDTMFDFLTRLGCRKIRDAYYIPAVFRDSYGRLYTESALIERAKGQHIEGVNIPFVATAINSGRLADWQDVYKVYRHFRMSVMSKRTFLPSVWVYEDIPCLDWNDTARSATVGKIIRFD